MADARVIGIDGRDRSAGAARSARSVLAGADRASGERARRRRRTTPLLPAEPSADAITPATVTPATVTPAKKTPATKATAKKSAPAAKKPVAVEKRAVAEKRAAAEKRAVAEKPAMAAKPVTVTRPAAAKRTAALNKPVAATRVIPPAKAPAVKKSSPAKKSPPVKVVGQETGRAPSPVAAAIALEVEEPLPAGGKHSVALAIASQLGEALLDAITSRAKPAEIEAKVTSILAFVRRRLTGDYELDDFGFDAEFTEKIPLAVLRPLYKHWFRVEVRGIENVPVEGGALIVANHSGTLPLDAVMTAVAVHETHPEHRFLRTLGADLVFQTPFLAGLARRAGATLASNPDAERLLSEGHLVGVWPEGFKGIGKPFSERYKLQRFGRGGFVSAALRTGTPIIPCSIVGAEEIFPIIGDIPSLARLLGLPYVPITPFFPLLGPLGAIPLPSKWLIEFGPPVGTDEYSKSAADDPMLVFDLTDQVRQSIQQTLYSLLVQRRSIFF